MTFLYRKLYENFHGIFPENYRYFSGNFPTYNPHPIIYIFSV